MTPGAFQVDARAVVQHRAGVDLQLDGLSLVLLPGSPPPEGGGVQQIIGAGYEPQRLVLAPTAYGSRTVRNTEPVQFAEVLDWQQATHVGVVNADGDVIAYGPLRSSRGSVAGYEATFAVGAVQVRFR